MRGEQIPDVIGKVVVSDHRIVIPLEQSTGIRLTVIMMLAINIISFIIMDLLPVVMREFVATRLGVLPRDSANESDGTRVGGLG